uniref:FAM3 metabolism regulating signaling molecule D n=1 Tax=Myripristis murdjan TaxID=586833 RepID=A0A667YUV2_9TELE
MTLKINIFESLLWLAGFLCIVAGIAVILLIWGVSISPSNIHDIVRQIILAAPKPAIKCNLSRRCPPDHFAFHIISGAADVVGPNICFEGKIIMSNLLNNVGLGLNMVLVNVMMTFVLYSLPKDPKDILAYLKAIKPGTIVLVASFDDVTPKMTNEMREIFVGLGSSLIKSVKRRDTWVFAGGGGTSKNSPFEKVSHPLDEKTNIYGAWPEMVEVAGCFPRKS